MLSRDKQQLLAALGSGMAADALLDRLRDRGTLEGGRSAPQGGHWINYNRKAVWLEDHTGFTEAMREAGIDKEAWRRIKPKVVVKVTWAEAAAHGARLPLSLREELDGLRRSERVENRRWSEFSDARGGWPWRRRFATDEAHAAAETEWNEVHSKHLLTLRDVRDRQRSAITRALPLTVDDEPTDLLELLEQTSPSDAVAPAPPKSAPLQTAALDSRARRGLPADEDGGANPRADRHRIGR